MALSALANPAEVGSWTDAHVALARWRSRLRSRFTLGSDGVSVLIIHPSSVLGLPDSRARLAASQGAGPPAPRPDRPREALTHCAPLRALPEPVVCTRGTWRAHDQARCDASESSDALSHDGLWHPSQAASDAGASAASASALVSQRAPPSLQPFQ